jgi:hypothetical protein
MAISRDIKRKFELVNALSKKNRPSLNDLHLETGIPESTIKRQISALREEFGMEILFIRGARGAPGEPGTAGYYMLTNWGILERAAFLSRYGKLEQASK